MADRTDAAPPLAEPVAPAWIFMALIIPFGAKGGFLTVALAYQLHAAGVDTQAIGALIALSYVPHTWKFLWAPLIDLTWSRRAWYLASSLVTAAGFVVMSGLGQDAQHLGALTALVLAVNLGSTFVGMSVESLMAITTPDERRGRVSGWFQAGNLGGLGLGGGLALWLMQHQGFSTIEAGAVLGGISVLCCLPLLRLAEPPNDGHASGALRGHLARLAAELWSLVRSRPGMLAIAICFLPIGSGAASNLWAAVAGDWHASDNTVALVNGALGGVVSAFGCLAGGFICDRLDRKTAYCLFGALEAALALGMSLAPRSETCFIVFAIAYAFVVGMTYAGFSGLVLEAIGRGAAATKYNLLASLSNAPIAYATYADGWAHAHWGAAAMLQFEAGLGLIGLAVFVAIVFFSRGLWPVRVASLPSSC